MDGAIFGLMGLLIAFTFTGAASRFDHRRDLIREEVNAIGTAWLRLDLLAPPSRSEVQTLMRAYVDQRIATHREMTDLEATNQASHRAAQIQAHMWTRLQEAVRTETSLPLTQAVLPAVNDMFDAGTTRVLAAEQHPPPAIYLTLIVLVLVTAFLTGFGQSKATRQSMLHLFGFAVTTTLALCLILDLEYPRLGLIRVAGADQALIDLRASMD